VGKKKGRGQEKTKDQRIQKKKRKNSPKKCRHQAFRQGHDVQKIRGDGKREGSKVWSITRLKKEKKVPKNLQQKGKSQKEKKNYESKNG